MQDQNTDQEKLPELESILNTLRAFANNKQFERVLLLEERCRRQREEIERLNKQVSQNAVSTSRYAKRPSWIAEVRDGMAVKDSFGRILEISSFGINGFVDQGGKDQHWYNHENSELLTDGAK